MIGGAPVPYSLRAAFADLGTVSWAFLEPLEGPTIYADFLERKGAGVHHAAFDHDGLDYDGCIAEFARRGFEVSQSGFCSGRYCYFPTRPAAHIVFELVDDAGGETHGPIKTYPDGAENLPAGFTRTASLGLVTGDLDETLRVYADRFGIGPWSIVDADDGASGTVRQASTMLGDILWEIVEPAPGPSLYRDHLDRRGAGVHHIGVAVGTGDYAARLAELGARGLDTLAADEGAAFLATDDVLGARLKVFADEGARA